MSERRKDPLRLNKTSICTIVFLDIVGYSQKPVAEQIECKNRFNALVSDALKDVALNDRIILDTGDGAAIALLGEPESALFTSLTIRDGLLEHNRNHPHSAFHVRIGINLGPVQMVRDINNHLNVIGDGINVAQRVMGFAAPDQVLVSRSYYEIVSRLSNDMLKMFSYSGVKQDKHVREHEVYEIRPADDHAVEVPEEQKVPEEAAMAAPPSRRKQWLWIGTALVLAVAGVVAIMMPKKSPVPAADVPPAPIQSASGAVAPEPQPASAPPEKPVTTTASSPSQPEANKAPAPAETGVQPASKKKRRSKPADGSTPVGSTNTAQAPAVPEPVREQPASSHSASAAPHPAPVEKKGSAEKTNEHAKPAPTPSCPDVLRSLNQCK